MPAGSQSVWSRSRTRQVWAAAAVLHFGTVVALLFCFRLIGERQPLIALLIYLPRVLYGAPLLVLAPLLWFHGPRRLLWVQASTALLVAGPLMGLHLNLPRSRQPSIRLLTYNVWFGARDPAAIAREASAADPDIILFQAAAHAADVALRAPPFDRFHYLHEWDFVAASRYPIKVVEVGRPEPPRLGPPWVRFQVDTPLGAVSLFSVHPHSPRSAFQALRGRGLRRLLPGGPPLDEEGTFLRLDRQLREIDEASRAAGPLRILAGDFNVSESSALLDGLFPGTEDAFASVGLGYGYTFPTGERRLPWLRLDRVLVGQGLTAISARVAGEHGSQHAALLVQIARR